MVDTFKYLLVAAYVVATYALSFHGMKKAAGLRGFSIGNKDLSPVLVGLTMAASIASTATFVINPGFVYTHGLSAYIHYGIAGYLGIAAALLLLCKGFRRLGDEGGALTIPHWMYGRYRSRGLSLFFALINLLSITFVVLILVGCAILCASLFDISQRSALILVIIFVFSYVLMGGAYAHAYTNGFQAVFMVLISLFLFVSGWKYLGGDPLGSLAAVSANYAAVFNPESALYYDLFSVGISSFLITFALMMQPHILTKTLYLKGEEDVNRFLITALITGFLFTLVLFVGFYARIKGLEVDRQDLVVAAYIESEFGASESGKLLAAFITVALLAAGMSTLDGILVAISAMVVNDLYLPFRRFGAAADGAQKEGLLLSRLVLVAVAVLATVLAWNPPPLVGLFAQKGVYGLAAASFAPILLGVWLKPPPPAWIMGLAAATGLFTHLLLNLFLGFHNPSVSASWAILAGLTLSGLLLWINRTTIVKKQVSPGGNP